MLRLEAVKNRKEVYLDEYGKKTVSFWKTGLVVLGKKCFNMMCE